MVSLSAALNGAGCRFSG